MRTLICAELQVGIGTLLPTLATRDTSTLITHSVVNLTARLSKRGMSLVLVTVIDQALSFSLVMDESWMMRARAFVGISFLPLVQTDLAKYTSIWDKWVKKAIQDIRLTMKCQFV